MNPYNDDPQRYSLDGVAEPDPGGDYILWSDAEQMLDRIAELERLSLDEEASSSSPCSDSLTASEWLRLSAWFADPDRKPAITSFTAGACRDAATAFEHSISQNATAQTPKPAP